MGKITKDTLVPLGLVTSAVMAIVGISRWASNVEFMTSANATQIQEVKGTFTTIVTGLGEILQRLSRIEGELARVPKRQSLPERE